MFQVADTPSPLQVRDAPAIPGLTFHRFRGESDYAIMVAILDACDAADHLDYVNTVEEIATVFAHLTNCDPYRGMLFAQVREETIAFGRVWWVEESATTQHTKNLSHLGNGSRIRRACAVSSESIQMFRQIGMDETALGVDTQNPHGALELYKSVGYREIKRHTFFNKPMEPETR